jgi:hypothetical protein
MSIRSVFQNSLPAAVLVAAALFFSCSSAPTGKKSAEAQRPLPAGVTFDDGGGRPYQKVGTVRAWQEFKTELDESFDDKEFQRRCRQAFREAAAKVLKIAQEHGGEAVIQVRSVVFLADGRKEYLPSAECADDGDAGEALVEGMAVRWTGPAPVEKTPAASPTRKPVKARKSARQAFEPAATH